MVKYKGILVQFMGLPNSGKTSRAKTLEGSIKQHEVENVGTLGALSMTDVIQKSAVYYEFNIKPHENISGYYTNEERQKEHESKIKEEIEYFSDLLKKEIKPRLKQDMIVIGYNPIQHNLIHRFKTAATKPELFEKYKNQTDKLLKNTNYVTVYLDVTNDQIQERQGDQYFKQLAEKKQKIKRRYENMGFSNYEIKETIREVKAEIEANEFLKNIYNKKEVQTYFDKARAEFKKFIVKNKGIQMPSSEPFISQDPMIKQYVEIMYNKKERQPKSL